MNRKQLKHGLLGAVALVATVTALHAQPGWVPPGNDPRGYYSDADHNGYYDRDGRYNRIRDDRPDRYGPPPPPPPPPGAYYQQGRYEESCHRGNTTAGTIFGALAGAALGAGVSHGNGGAAIGGAVLGG